MVIKIELFVSRLWNKNKCSSNKNTDVLWLLIQIIA